MRNIYINFLSLIIFTFFSLASGQERKSQAISPSAQSLRAGSFIDVNSSNHAQSSYSIEQLIKNVLINGGSDCNSNVSNVVVSPNLMVSSNNRSWGYFNKANTNFPFDEGVVLVTGRANSVGNSFIAGTLSDNLQTSGDVDLATAIGVQNSSLNDATYIEFDFVPVSNQISFNYIFASEEYISGSSFQCTYTDGFALLLKKVGDPNYTNLAVLPNGGGPVNVTNIHPFVSGSCPAVNEQYFGGYNNASIETNFGGRTVPLTATATVIPGETYHFKMVLADNQDGSYDSGVFLQAGSFNIGIEFVDDNGVELPDHIQLCEGQSQMLTVDLQSNGATYQWFFNGVAIAGATSNTYVANQAGVYSVEVITQGSSCAATDSVDVQFVSSPQVNDNSLVICSSGTSGVFDLTSAQPNISTTPNVTFTYYENLADAQAGNANSIATPTAYTSGNATVYVLVKNNLGCSSIAELDLSISTTPDTPTITASSLVICGDETVTLTSSATSGNVWSTGETTNTITVTNGGTYTLTVENGGCVSQAATVTITKTENPNLQITGNAGFCEGGSTVLSATATGTGNTYLWSDGTTTAQNTITVAGTYTVTLTTATGCQFVESITVTENELPQVQNATLEMCSQDNTATFDLTAAQNNISTSNGVTFTYYTNQNDAQAGNTNNIPNPTTYNSTTATIYVRVSNGGCFQVAELQLNHTTTPTAIITASSNVICGGIPVTLTSNYATGNVWSTGETTQTITVTNAGTYTLMISNGSCVSETVSVDIIENADPNLSITGDLSFCAGSSTTLTANTTGTGLSYQWSNGATAQTTVINQPGTYTVTVTTSGGCVYTESVTLTVDGMIDAIIAQPQQINCINPTITLDASASVIESNATIQWVATNGGNIVNGANTLTPTVDAGGTYTLTITSTEGLMCSDEASVTVVKNTTPPTIGLTATNLTVCLGNSVTLTASGAATYTWTGAGTSGSGSTQVVTPTSNTTYTVTGVGANGCAGNTATITITVVPTIESTIQDIQFCAGDSGILDAGAGNNYTYQWSTGETTQTITVTEQGIYNVTISNGACSETYSATVSYTPVPTIQMVEYNDNTITIQLVQNITNAEYSIDGGLTWQTSNIFVNVEANVTYNILVREEGADCYSATEFYAFNVSNLITPNNDGYNDVIDFSGVRNYKGFSVLISDKYGKVVFRGSSSKYIWDGTYVGFSLPTDTYWYHITWEDPISGTMIKKDGWIMLKNRNN